LRPGMARHFASTYHSVWLYLYFLPFYIVPLLCNLFTSFAFKIILSVKT